MKVEPDFQVTLSNKSDEHLCEMIPGSEDYLPEAIELARMELSRRALSSDRLAQLQTASQLQRQTEEERAEQPLTNFANRIATCDHLGIPVRKAGLFPEDARALEVACHPLPCARIPGALARADRQLSTH